VRWLLRRYPCRDQELPTVLMAIVLALIFAAGICTQRLGVFTIFGAFLLGLLFHREHAFVEAWRHQMGQFVLVFFLPIFFTYTGLRTNVLGLDSLSDWMWCAFIFLTAVLAKVIPAYGAARLAGLRAQQAALIGVLMNTRALMELIVLNIGLSLGFIPPDVFTMLVLMAVATTAMTGPALQLLLRRQGWKMDTRVDA
jgi:K+:H+ antiporter